MTEDDYKSLEKCYVSQRYADAAQIRRVDSLDGRDRVGRNGAGDYAGLLFSYIDPVSRLVVGERLRLDHPPFDAKGKPKYKYLSPPGQRMHFYWPFADPAWLEDPTMPIIIVEGEKKYLAAHRAAFEKAIEGRPPYFAIALAGVWAWLGKTGITTNEKGRRVAVKGVIGDFDRVQWKNRRVVIFFDSNVLTNDQVARARNQLARELASRGALVFIVDLPGDVGGQPINGVDDFLAAAGLDPFIELFESALRWDWRTELHKTKEGKVRAGGVHNVLVALRYAPELHGMLGYNQFSEQAEIRKRTPWQAPPGPWRDSDDVYFRDWLENRGIFAAAQTIGEAVAAYAAEHGFHPVRDYLESLQWDGTERIDSWLTSYAAVKPDSNYVRAVGKRWLISAVARVFEPGSKVDHTVIFEGPQGAGKSRLIKILGGEFYSDDIADLQTKDAAMSLKGVWIAELSELDAMTKADVTRIKSFISRATDHYRPPYGRHFVDSPRQCVFAGSINHANYLKDETGGRRFWPVACAGDLCLNSLEEDRDQLWAEAVVRYRAGDKWWLDDGALIKAAGDEQDARFQSDPWEPLVDTWLLSRTETTTAEVIEHALQKPVGQWTRADEIRVGAILRRLGWETSRPRSGGSRRRIYRYVETSLPAKKEIQ